jgi:hypothetical protein
MGDDMLTRTSIVLNMLDARPDRRRRTLGADKAYDVAEFVADLRQRNVTAHVAQNTTNRGAAIDGRTTRHSGYAVSQILRKRIEETFGWTKSTAGMRKTHHRGLARVGSRRTRPSHNFHECIDDRGRKSAQNVGFFRIRLGDAAEAAHPSQSR